jgi:hypothetical protein
LGVGALGTPSSGGAGVITLVLVALAAGTAGVVVGLAIRLWVDRQYWRLWWKFRSIRKRSK